MAWNMLQACRLLNRSENLGPSALSAGMSRPGEVVLAFDEPVQINGATYTFNNGITFEGQRLAGLGSRSIILSVAGVSQGEHAVQVSGVRDSDNRAMSGPSTADFLGLAPWEGLPWIRLALTDGVSEDRGQPPGVW